MKLTKLIALMGMAVLLAGCAGKMKTLPDGRVLAMTTVGDTLDRSASFTQLLVPTGYDSEGRPTGYRQDGSDLTVGSTVGGQLVVAGGTALIGNGIQAAAAVRTAKIKADAARCPNPDGSGGTIICNSTVAVGGTSVANANAGAVANAETEVHISESNTSGGCNPCRSDDFDF